MPATTRCARSRASPSIGCWESRAGASSSKRARSAPAEEERPRKVSKAAWPVGKIRKLSPSRSRIRGSGPGGKDFLQRQQRSSPGGSRSRPCLRIEATGSGSLAERIARAPQPVGLLHRAALQMRRLHISSPWRRHPALRGADGKNCSLPTPRGVQGQRRPSLQPERDGPGQRAWRTWAICTMCCSTSGPPAPLKTARHCYPGCVDLKGVQEG